MSLRFGRDKALELLFDDDFALLDGESSDEEDIGMQEYLGDDAVLPEDMADLRRAVDSVEIRRW